MPQQDSYLLKRGSLSQHGRGDGMAKQMGGSTARSGNLSPVERLANNNRNSRMRAKLTKRRATTDKDGVAVGPGATAFEIRHQCASDFLAKRQSGLKAALSANADPAVFPVDIL
jgi:hypothetical protein